MIETGVLVDRNHAPLLWHVPPGASQGSLPDSRDLWDVIWENRERVLGFAHVHPWDGQAAPSNVDLTTFDAVERALGRPLEWWIVTFSETRRVTSYDPTNLVYSPAWYVSLPVDENSLPWIAHLRHLSRSVVGT